jgi:hypothetical protein
MAARPAGVEAPYHLLYLTPSLRCDRIVARFSQITKGDFKYMAANQQICDGSSISQTVPCKILRLERDRFDLKISSSDYDRLSIAKLFIVIVTPGGTRDD